MMGFFSVFFGFSARLRVLSLVAAGIVALGATAAASEGGGGGKATAFGPGEKTLQLAPLWVPVTGARSQAKGVPGYRPLTFKITSRDGGAMAMCHRLPHIVEAFLFEMNREPAAMKGGRVDLAGVNRRLFAEAERVAGPGVVKSVEAIDGAPHPDKANQELLGLCQ